MIVYIVFCRTPDCCEEIMGVYANEAAAKREQARLSKEWSKERKSYLATTKKAGIIFRPPYFVDSFAVEALT